MRFTKRLFLFLAVNACVILTLSFLISFFNLTPYVNSHGLNVDSLFVFCLVWGMGGALISLLISRKIAKWSFSIELVNKASQPKLYSMVEKIAKKAGLRHMPEVGIFHHNEMNAFATGPSKKRSLVAVSTGLLNHMPDAELEAVLAHEVAHIENGDMVTLTLLQGVINVFVMFGARILAYAILNRGNNRSSSRGGYFALTILFEIVFMLLGSMVVCAFSRYREFRADKGGALYASKQGMISALKHLMHQRPGRGSQMKGESVRCMMIHSRKSKLFSRLFATHPPLEMRIKRLETGL